MDHTSYIILNLLHNNILFTWVRSIWKRLLLKLIPLSLAKLFTLCPIARGNVQIMSNLDKMKKKEQHPE